MPFAGKLGKSIVLKFTVCVRIYDCLVCSDYAVVSKSAVNVLQNIVNIAHGDDEAVHKSSN